MRLHLESPRDQIEFERESFLLGESIEELIDFLAFRVELTERKEHLTANVDVVITPLHDLQAFHLTLEPINDKLQALERLCIVDRLRTLVQQDRPRRTD